MKRQANAMITLYFFNGLLGKHEVYRRTDDRQEINHLKTRFPHIGSIPTDREFLITGEMTA